MTQPMPSNLYHSRFMWHDKSNALFVNYQAKLKKSVCLLSTMHSTPDVDNGSPKQKPCVIMFYNQNNPRKPTLLSNCRKKKFSRNWVIFIFYILKLILKIVLGLILLVFGDVTYMSHWAFLYVLAAKS